MKVKIISKSGSETESAGYEFAKSLKRGDTVLLYGDLGYGKTTFVKGVAKGLDIKSRIISPTYTLIREHEGMYHLDLYRITRKEDLESLGLDEIFNNDAIKFIEWPENLFDKLPEKRIEVKILLNSDSTRTINIYKYE